MKIINNIINVYTSKLNKYTKLIYSLLQREKSVISIKRIITAYCYMFKPPKYAIWLEEKYNIVLKYFNSVVTVFKPYKVFTGLVYMLFICIFTTAALHVHLHNISYYINVILTLSLFSALMLVLITININEVNSPSLLSKLKYCYKFIVENIFKTVNSIRGFIIVIYNNFKRSNKTKVVKISYMIIFNSIYLFSVGYLLYILGDLIRELFLFSLYSYIYVIDVPKFLELFVEKYKKIILRVRRIDFWKNLAYIWLSLCLVRLGLINICSILDKSLISNYIDFNLAIAILSVTLFNTVFPSFTLTNIFNNLDIPKLLDNILYKLNNDLHIRLIMERFIFYIADLLYDIKAIYFNTDKSALSTVDVKLNTDKSALSTVDVKLNTEKYPCLNETAKENKYINVKEYIDIKEPVNMKNIKSNCLRDSLLEWRSKKLVDLANCLKFSNEQKCHFKRKISIKTEVREGCLKYDIAFVNFCSYNNIFPNSKLAYDFLMLCYRYNYNPNFISEGKGVYSYTFPFASSCLSTIKWSDFSESLIYSSKGNSNSLSLRLESKGGRPPTTSTSTPTSTPTSSSSTSSSTSSPRLKLRGGLNSDNDLMNLYYEEILSDINDPDIRDLFKNRPKIFVETTRPVVGDDMPQPIISDRLIIRSLRPTDLEAYHTLLTQPEAMNYDPSWSIFEEGSWDIGITEMELNDELPPHNSSHLYLGIFLNNSDGSEGDIIGDGGIWSREEGEWPELGYRFKKEYWNKGYATEFTTAYMRYWWDLPRVPAILHVHPATIDFNDGKKVVERVCAFPLPENVASIRVLQKSGFEPFEFEGRIFRETSWRILRPIMEPSGEALEYNLVRIVFRRVFRGIRKIFKI